MSLMSTDEEQLLFLVKSLSITTKKLRETFGPHIGTSRKSIVQSLIVLNSDKPLSTIMDVFYEIS